MTKNFRSHSRILDLANSIVSLVELLFPKTIDKLKKELDTIEIRYQHLLNENCMIGEDFRSQARENKLYSDELNEEIKRLNNEIKKM